MSEYKKGLLGAIIAAMLSASLLSAGIYYLVSLEDQPVTLEDQPVTLAFALGEGRQFSGNYAASFDWPLLVNFTFLNGTIIQPFPWGESWPSEYEGELNATELEEITVADNTESLVFHDAGTLRFSIAAVENKIINVTLVDQETIDLGTKIDLGGGWLAQSSYYNSSSYADLAELIASLNITIKRTATGYWESTNYNWEITASQLSEILNGSGVATITFNTCFSTELKYKIITMSEGVLTGNASLSWSGAWGTLQLTYKEGKISLVKYNFKTIKLIMIATKSY